MPAKDLAMSQFEDREGSSLLDDVKEEVKQEEEVPVKVEEPLMKSQLSAEELEKIIYLQKVDDLKEKKFVENMTYLLESGFTNFEVNLNLLKRNNNDIGIVINNLCNGTNITDSMFI